MSTRSNIPASMACSRQGRLGVVGTGLAVAAFALLAGSEARAADLTWKGFDWNITNGGMAGVADGSPNNVVVDQNGYLHLKITNTNGTWTAAELFTTEKLGFGTYQWQVEGPIDRFDKNVVLGLFPYGPAAGIGADGTNEIDIEYSFWGDPKGPNGDWTDYPASGKTIGELSYTFSLGGGTSSTSRFVWTSTSIEDFLIQGFQPITSTTGLLKTWKYAPTTPTTNIPQQPLPLGINLWCFNAPPSDGQNVEVILHDFQFVKEGSTSSTSSSSSSSGSTSVGSSAASSTASSTSTVAASSSAVGVGGAGAASTASTGTTVGSGATTAATSGGAGGAGASQATTTSGATTTSSDGTGAGGASTGAAHGDTGNRGGCSCSVLGTAGDGGREVIVVFAVVAVARRQRRRASRAPGLRKRP